MARNPLFGAINEKWWTKREASTASDIIGHTPDTMAGTKTGSGRHPSLEVKDGRRDEPQNRVHVTAPRLTLRDLPMTKYPSVSTLVAQRFVRCY